MLGKYLADFVFDDRKLRILLKIKSAIYFLPTVNLKTTAKTFEKESPVRKKSVMLINS